MARPLRIEYPGALYHVTSRGNARGDIYLSDVDRLKFLEVLASTVVKYNWVCHAYCLMDNHYHAIIETPDPNLSLGMRQLNGVYTQAFNRTHQRVGHVFQGRYKAIVVEKDSYLLELCRYVVLNPVRAGLVTMPDEWKWSSYKITANRTRVPEYLTIDWVLGQFSKHRATARKRYRKFVTEGVANPMTPWQKLSGQIFLGGDKFISYMQEFLRDSQDIKEIPRSQRYPGRPPLELFFSNIARENKKARNQGVVTAHIGFGYTLKEIGECLGIHYTTVSRIVDKSKEK